MYEVDLFEKESINLVRGRGDLLLNIKKVVLINLSKCFDDFQLLTLSAAAADHWNRGARKKGILSALGDPAVSGDDLQCHLGLL